MNNSLSHVIVDVSV